MKDICLICIALTLVPGCSPKVEVDEEKLAKAIVSELQSADRAPVVRIDSSDTALLTYVEQIAVLENLGFGFVQKTDDFVQYSKGNQVVDLDLDDGGVHVTVAEASDTKLDPQKVETAIEIYEALGIRVRGLRYKITPSNGVGPDLHRANNSNWSITKKVWPRGLGGMFFTFEAELRN